MPFSTHHSIPRGVAAGMLMLSLALWGCSGDELTGVSGGTGAKKSPTPTPTELLGGVGPGGSATPTPTPTPTPSPTPSNGLAPDPDPTPFAIGITVALQDDTINLAPYDGGPGLYRYTTHVSGVVTLSNALTTTDIDWRSSNNAIASVASDGTITAGSVAGGTVKITGTSKDGLVSKSVDLTVTAFGDAEVVVD